MTRTASILAVVLAFLVALAPWIGEDHTLGTEISLAAALLLMVAGHGTYRRKTPFHLLFLLLAMAVLARFLPSFFMEVRFWPDLAIILVSAIAFGLGLLGFILDHVRLDRKS